MARVMSGTGTAYLLAIGAAVAGSLFLFWTIAGVGLLGDDGYKHDRMYLAVFAVGLIGAVISRLAPAGMARTSFAMALVQGFVGLLALLTGLYDQPVPEVLGLNAIPVSAFLGSWLLFRLAAGRQGNPATSGGRPRSR